MGAEEYLNITRGSGDSATMGSGDSVSMGVERAIPQIGYRTVISSGPLGLHSRDSGCLGMMPYIECCETHFGRS